MSKDDFAKADTVVPGKLDGDFDEPTIGDRPGRGRPLLTDPKPYAAPIVTSDDEARATVEGPADPLIEMQRFHGHIRQALRGLEMLVSQEGHDGSVEVVPQGLVDFFRGPFVAHDIDEEASLLPRLRRAKHSRHLDEMIQAVTRQHEEIEKQLDRLLPELDKVVADVTCDMGTIAELTHALRDLLEDHLQLEEREIFPFARLLLTDDDLDTLDRELRQRAAKRASGDKSVKQLS